LFWRLDLVVIGYGTGGCFGGYAAIAHGRSQPNKAAIAHGQQQKATTTYGAKAHNNNRRLLWPTFL
jgi:hypothetical protein